MQETGNSSIVYTVTMEDVVAFNLFHFRHSSTIRRMQQRAMIIYAVTAFLGTLGALSLMHMPLSTALVGALLNTLWTVGYLQYYRKRGYIKRVRKMVQQMFAEDKNPSLLGPHTLEVDEEGFTAVTAFQRTRYAWGALVRIETEPGYTYLYTGAQSACVISHDSITGGDFRAVLAQIGRHYQPDRTLAPQLSPQVLPETAG